MAILSQSLLSAISHPARWKDTLADICAYLDVPAALISLRDRRTAAILRSEWAGKTSKGPLVHGFDRAAISDYLAQVAASNPWIDVAREIHPHRPYPMSRYLPPARLRGTPFGRWIEGQGITDSVICEIADAGHQWSALSFYFDAARTDTDRLIARLEAILPDLRAAWQASVRLQAAELGREALSGVLASLPMPAAVVCHDGFVRAINAKATALLADLGATVRPGLRLALPEDTRLERDGEASLPEVALTVPGPSGLRASVRPVLKAELMTGAPHDLSLVTFTLGPAPSDRPIWQDPALTDREATLVRHVAQGLLFREAQHEMGVSYPRVMQLWKSARVKLGLRDVNDLRVAHRTGQYGPGSSGKD